MRFLYALVILALIALFAVNARAQDEQSVAELISNDVDESMLVEVDVENEAETEAEADAEVDEEIAAELEDSLLESEIFAKPLRWVGRPKDISLPLNGVPNWNPATFDWRVARFWKEFGSAAYCPTNLIASWTCASCVSPALKSFSLLGSVSNPPANLFGFVGIMIVGGKPAIVVSFRGTLGPDLNNWVTNLKFLKTTFTSRNGVVPGKLHAGFANGYAYMAPQVRKLIDLGRSKYPNARLIFLGHSLGGALATVAAADHIGLSGMKSIYTFGAPRVGDQTFVSWINAKIPDNIRVTHNTDIVPKVPPRMLGFLHAGREVFLNAPGTSYNLCAYNPTGVEDDSCITSQGINPLKISSYVSDHLNYLGETTQCQTVRFAQMASTTEALFAETSGPAHELLASVYALAAGTGDIATMTNKELIEELSTMSL